jgi:hypothetical protein
MDDIDKDVKVILRFIIESKLKHSFLFTEKINKDIDKTITFLFDYFIKKKKNKKNEEELNQIIEIIKATVTNSINIENLINENNKVDEKLINSLNNTINKIKDISYKTK